ncbi:hypothetical protein [Halodesulfovibrio marinisediminis]|uniref:Nickel transport protein n=1 Tax=Halodesulfovibrio marinisediminis DSM 17456 TaxID=1121457 RepID=A0A1N6DJW6_9BACT|nr:hypothetical protein [Halodesulfovibrio marinisediminis]SIN71082.1 nickel transport protein [Halodesulfovibrio marinisediminis DSM 17456]
MRLSTILFVFILTCILTTSALAHRVNVFAWVEGNMVHSESFFSSGNRAQKSAITATDKKTGKVIAKGTTNNNGEWSFTLPADAIQSKDPIVIALDAGQGHAGSWTLETEDFADAPPLPATSTKTTPTSSKPETSVQPQTPVQLSTQTNASSSTTVTLTKTELDKLIRDAVRQEIAPLKAQVSKLNAQILQPKTTIKDIFGGIGYILGLLGLAAFMHYRKKA